VRNARAALELLLVIGAVSAGCSVLEAGEGPDADTVQRQAEVYCGRTFECCGERVAGQSRSQCETVSKVSLRADANDLSDALDREVATYDADAAERCLDTLAEESCDTWTLFVERRGPDICNDLVTGQLGEGESCRSDLECDRGACMTDEVGGELRCRTWAKLGESCSEPVRRTCEPPLACRLVRNETHECVELGSEGAPCEHGSDCHSSLCVEERCAAACDRRK
jgi:hypothetical protein